MIKILVLIGIVVSGLLWAVTVQTPAGEMAFGGGPTLAPVPTLPFGTVCQGRVSNEIPAVRVQRSVQGAHYGWLWNGEGVSIYALTYDEQGQVWYQIAYNEGLAWVSGQWIAYETPDLCEVLP